MINQNIWRSTIKWFSMFGGPQAIMFINILPNLYLAEWQADRRPSVIAFLSLLFSFKLISNHLNKCIYLVWICIYSIHSPFACSSARPQRAPAVARRESTWLGENMHCKIIYFNSWSTMPTHVDRWCLLRCEARMKVRAARRSDEVL